MSEFQETGKIFSLSTTGLLITGLLPARDARDAYRDPPILKDRERCRLTVLPAGRPLFFHRVEEEDGDGVFFFFVKGDVIIIFSLFSFFFFFRFFSFLFFFCS